VNEQRIKLVHQLLDPEERSQNYTEFAPPDNRRSLEIKSIMGEILAELGTVSMFGTSERRVICVMQAKELLRGGGGRRPRKKKTTRKKKTATADSAAFDPVETFCNALENALPQSENILIFTVYEDDDKNVGVDLKSSFYEFFRKNGEVRHLKQHPLVFEFEDALLRRDIGQLMTTFRKWYKPDNEVKQRIFSTILKLVRLLLQVRTWMSLLDSDMHEEDIAAEFFPQGLTPNFLKEHPFRKDKLMKGAQHWTREELLEAHSRLLALNKLLYPTQRDTFVADFQMSLELYLVQLCSGQFAKNP
jgi:hypothetical protein